MERFGGDAESIGANAVSRHLRSFRFSPFSGNRRWFGSNVDGVSTAQTTVRQIPSPPGLTGNIGSRPYRGEIECNRTRPPPACPRHIGRVPNGQGKKVALVAKSPPAYEARRILSPELPPGDCEDQRWYGVHARVPSSVPLAMPRLERHSVPRQ